MALEQLVAKLGLNIGPFVKALDVAKGHAKKFSSDVKSEIGSSIGKSFGGAAAVTGLVLAAKTITDYADSIHELAADLGVTTDFLQGFTTNVARNSGTVEGANKALTKFAQLVGEASAGSLEAQMKLGKFGISVVDAGGNLRSTGALMLDMIDSISKLPTEAERAAAAMDVFGKSGSQLLGVISQGKAANEEFIKSVEKLSAQAIEDLGMLKSKAESLFNSIVVSIGEQVSRIVRFGRFLREFTKTFSISGSIENVAKQELETKNKASATPPVKAANSIFDELKNKIAKEREDQRKKELEAEKKLGDEMKRNLEKLHQFNEQRKAAQAGLLGAQTALSQRRGDRGRFTLEELATSNFRFSGRLGQEQIRAREAFMLERFAEINRLRGFGDLSLQQLSRAEQIRGGLTNLQQAERFPFADLTDRVEQSNAELRRLNALAQTEGVLIRPTNGE